ncbi:MAG: hypothetical protein EB075_14675 [Bacteroidetes bacterium]|nr:hypothetical protein [Bacteroidota bacterium]
MANSVPNWQHHSRKEQKRKLKPQALRDARRRRQALKNKLKGRGNHQPLAIVVSDHRAFAR